jgi:DNA-binding transcriptional regulator YiaG
LKNMFGYSCDKCGKGVVRSNRVSNYQTKIDGTPFTVDSAVIGVCSNCGARYFNARELKSWREAFFAEQQQKGTLLSAAEISDVRHQMEMNVADFSRLIGCSRQALYFWESLERATPQSRMADLLLRLVRADFTEGPVHVIDLLLETARGQGIEIPVPRQISTDESRESSAQGSSRMESNEDGKFENLYCKSARPADFSPRLRLVA